MAAADARSPDATVQASPHAVVWLASHLNSARRVAMFRDAVGSIAAQTVRPRWLCISFSVDPAVEVCDEDIRHACAPACAAGIGVRVFRADGPRAVSQFRHLAELAQRTAAEPGQVVFLADDDDRYHPTRIARQLAYHAPPSCASRTRCNAIAMPTHVISESWMPSTDWPAPGIDSGCRGDTPCVAVARETLDEFFASEAWQAIAASVQVRWGLLDLVFHAWADRHDGREVTVPESLLLYRKSPPSECAYIYENPGCGPLDDDVLRQRLSIPFRELSIGPMSADLSVSRAHTGRPHGLPEDGPAPRAEDAGTTQTSAHP